MWRKKIVSKKLRGQKVTGKSKEDGIKRDFSYIARENQENRERGSRIKGKKKIIYYGQNKQNGLNDRGKNNIWIDYVLRAFKYLFGFDIP